MTARGVANHCRVCSTLPASRSNGSLSSLVVSPEGLVGLLLNLGKIEMKFRDKPRSKVGCDRRAVRGMVARLLDKAARIFHDEDPAVEAVTLDVRFVRALGRSYVASFGTYESISIYG